MPLMLLDIETATETEPTAGRRRRRRLLALIAFVAAVAVAGGVYGWGRWQEASEPSLRTAEVKLGDIEKTVTALGTLQPKDYVDVGAQVSGQLESVHVEIGDIVKKDQLLAEID